MYLREDVKRLIAYLPRVQNREAFALYAMHFIRSFALSLPGIFVPIFIFDLANKPAVFAGAFLNNIFWICAYYMCASLVALLCNVFLLNAVFIRLGFKRSILLGIVFLSMAIASLLFAQQHFFATAAVAIFIGISTHFYWIPFHVFFVRKTCDGDNFGQETALQLFVASFASSVGPLLAGLIIQLWGFNVMFGVALFLIVIACVPVLLFVSDQRHRRHSIVSIMRTYLGRQSPRRLAYAFAGNSAESQAYEMLWPLLLYLVLTDFIRVGALTTLSMLLSSFVILWVGKAIEQRRHQWMESVAVWVNSLLYVVRIFIRAPWAFYAVDVLDRSNGKMYSIAYTSAVYDAAKEMGDSDMVVFRETIAHAAQTVAPALVFCVIWFAADWRIVFVLPALFSLCVLYIFAKRA